MAQIKLWNISVSITLYILILLSKNSVQPSSESYIFLKKIEIPHQNKIKKTLATVINWKNTVCEQKLSTMVYKKNFKRKLTLILIMFLMPKGTFTLNVMLY